MFEPHAKQNGYLKARSRLAEQVAWLMVWPTLTVLLVVGAVYFDRMHILKNMTGRNGVLVTQAAGSSLLERFHSIASDIKYIEINGALQNLLNAREILPGSEFHNLVSKLAEANSDYRRISLFNREGKELIRTGSMGPVAPKTQEDDHLPGDLLPLAGALDAITQDKIQLFAVRYSGKDDASARDIRMNLRFAKAVIGDKGEATGMIVIDYSPSVLIQSQLTLQSVVGAHLYLVDHKGDIITDLMSGEGENFYAAKYQSKYRDSFPEVWAVVKRQKHGHIFHQGGSFAFSTITPFPDHIASDPAIFMKKSKNTSEKELKYHFFLISKIPASYFKEQKNEYIRFLLILAATLLVPSVVVCIFLARSRTRIRIEESLRYTEHEKHRAELEDKVQQRTRDLDDINLQLSAEIAERLSTENRLRGSNELLSVMLESLDGIIYVAEIDTHEILFANEYVKRLFGFDPVGRKCWQFIHSSQEGPCEFCTNDKLIDDAGNPCEPHHWEYQNPFNKKWYAAKDQAIRWSNGKLVRLEIAIDITEHKRLQHFLREARKQAEVAIGARSRFVALVAHDLKSPFFSITQMLRRILERETFSHKVHRQFLENIVENGHRMLQMIDNLLAMDRFEAGDVKLDKSFFDVSSMADDVCQNFRHPAFEKGIKLVNSIPVESRIYADRYLYFMVLNNLTSNAIKFSERGGEIEFLKAGGEKSMTVAVRDAGRGMTKEYKEDLFKADVKTSSQGTGGERGSGLGLIFCQDIIKAHAGNIRVESEYESGSTFYISLPECSDIDARKESTC